ncbi:hypothetical protein JCM10212_004693 [Sporobolomyces blumeae]
MPAPRTRSPPPVESTARLSLLDPPSPAPSPAPSSSSPSRSAPPRGPLPPITYRAYEGEHDLDLIVDLVDAELSEPYNLYTYRYFLDEWPHLCFFAFSGPTAIGCIICKSEPHAKSAQTVPFASALDEQRWVDLAGGPIVEVPTTATATTTSSEPAGGGPGATTKMRPLMRGYLAMLSTRKEYRGLGVATHLVRLSLTAMLRPPRAYLSTLPTPHPSHYPPDELVLETESDNVAALTFYEKLGFVAEKGLERFYLNGKDAKRLRLDCRRLFRDGTEPRPDHEGPSDRGFDFVRLAGEGADNEGETIHGP